MDHLIDAIEAMVPAKKEANREAAHQGYTDLNILGWGGLT